MSLSEVVEALAAMLEVVEALVWDHPAWEQEAPVAIMVKVVAPEVAAVALAVVVVEEERQALQGVLLEEAVACGKGCTEVEPLWSSLELGICTSKCLASAGSHRSALLSLQPLPLRRPLQPSLHQKPCSW